MDATFSLRRLAAFWMVLAAAVFPRAAQAGPVEDFNTLNQQCQQQAAGGKFREAEQTALQMRQVAEGPLSNEPRAMIVAVITQAQILNVQGRYAAAEPLLKWAIASAERTVGADHPDLGGATRTLGEVYDALGRYADADPLYRRSLAIYEKSEGQQGASVAVVLHGLGLLYAHQGRYPDAERLLKRALAIWEAKADSANLAMCLESLGGVYTLQSRYAEAEPLLKRSLAIRQQTLPADNPMLAGAINQLGMLYFSQSRYADAEPLYRQALAIRRKALAADAPDLGVSLNNLALVCDNQGRYVEAESLLKEALPTLEKGYGAGNPLVATALSNLGHLYTIEGRYVEAETLFLRAVAIHDRSLTPDHPDLALGLHNLASLYQSQGRFSEAEPLFKRARTIFEKSLGPEHHYVATNLNGLGQMYVAQNRYDDAERLFKQALALFEKVRGPNHEDVGLALNNLAQLYLYQGRFKDAEPLAKRSLAIWEKGLGPEHPQTVIGLGNLAYLYASAGRYDEAAPLFDRAVALAEKAVGPEHPTLANILACQARMYDWEKQYDKAEPLVDRAIEIMERSGSSPGSRSTPYHLRARIQWQDGRRSEAVSDLRQAMQLAEQQRATISGGEQERAAGFGNFGDLFETMVAWQCELGDASEALSAAERGRARSLLDELSLMGADLDLGRSSIQREQIHKHTLELQQRIATIEKQIEQIEAQRGSLSKDERLQKRKRLEIDLNKAKAELYEYHRDQRSASPVYRNLLSVGGGPPRLSQLRRMVGNDGLMLVYMLGRDGGYVIVVGPKTAAVEKLDIDDLAAETLGTTAGPLTAARLSAALVNRNRNGVLQQLQRPELGPGAVEKLAALWKLLIPEPQRKALTNGSVKRLVVVPDGQLALLPFETLVVATGENPKYLLDAGPPVEYGPSATVLYNLAERRPAAAMPNREPVLTVGNPNYAPAGAVASAKPGLIDQLAARSRYNAMGGKLNALPFTGKESKWVAEGFVKNGVKTLSLVDLQATEANVRKQAPGRRILHLACHGLADQAYGNFYGALALTPGGNGGDPADDGFLTLAEIYGLDLRGTELTILSACETNFGPEQTGEGVWALSRGFLVAGSRRVVASNWLVDDEEGANLVGHFCRSLATVEKSGQPADYAAALQQAKRWVRGQDQWKSPYYWGTFVLVGPQ